MNDRKKAVHVGTVVLETVKDHLWLSFAILAVVAGAVGAALVPPLVLGRIVDGLTAGEGLTLRLPLWYLAFTALAGGLESARESALTVFGQKTTHCPAEPPDGKGGPPARRRAEPSGAGGAGVPLCGGRGHGGDPVHRRDHQYGGGYLPDPQYSGGGGGSAAGDLPICCWHCCRCCSSLPGSSRSGCCTIS